MHMIVAIPMKATCSRSRSSTLPPRGGVPTSWMKHPSPGRCEEKSTGERLFREMVEDAQLPTQVTLKAAEYLAGFC